MSVLTLVDVAFMGDGSSPEEIAKTARLMGFRTVAVDGLRDYLRVNGVSLIPRHTFTDPNKSMLPKGNVLRVFRCVSPEAFKLTNRVMTYAHAVELGGKMLGKLGRKNAKKLANTAIPVIIRASEVYDALVRGRSLSGLATLLKLYEAGRIILSMGSGAKVLKEVRHGITLIALLMTLGLSEAKALAALTTNPKTLMERAGYVIK